MKTSSTPIVKSNYTIITGSLHTSELSWKRIGTPQVFKTLTGGKPIISILLWHLSKNELVNLKLFLVCNNVTVDTNQSGVFILEKNHIL